MPITLHFIHADGRERHVQAETGQSLMRAAVAAGIEAIAADCGGTLSCATCHVRVEPPWAAQLPPPLADEAAMLELTASPRTPHSRLSCQLLLTAALHGLTIHLPATQY